MEKSKKYYTSTKILLILSIMFLLSIIIIPICLNIKIPKTYISYVSISTNNELAYLNLNVDTNTEIKFVKTDFAILKNNIPTEIHGFVTEVTYTPSSKIYTISSSIKIDSSGTIIISLNLKPTELNNIKYLYKGQELKLGEKIKI